MNFQGSTTAASGGISFSTINNTLIQLVQSSESSLSTLLTTISKKSDPSTTDMLNLQQSLEAWTTIIQASSTTTKDFYDALKETVQKAS
jgi:hypothetical protein